MYKQFVIEFGGTYKGKGTVTDMSHNSDGSLDPVELLSIASITAY